MVGGENKNLPDCDGANTALNSTEIINLRTNTVRDGEFYIGKGFLNNIVEADDGIFFRTNFTSRNKKPRNTGL